MEPPRPAIRSPASSMTRPSMLTQPSGPFVGVVRDCKDAGQLRVRLCQNLAALFEVLDLRGAYAVETVDQPVLEDAGDLLGGMEPRDVDEVGGGLIEMKRLRYVVGREHDLGS